MIPINLNPEKTEPWLKRMCLEQQPMNYGLFSWYAGRLLNPKLRSLCSSIAAYWIRFETQWADSAVVDFKTLEGPVKPIAKFRREKSVWPFSIHISILVRSKVGRPLVNNLGHTSTLKMILDRQFQYEKKTLIMDRWILQPSLIKLFFFLFLLIISMESWEMCCLQNMGPLLNLGPYQNLETVQPIN